MMKKILSMIMAMLLLWSFAISAFAEDEFILRNGIRFGDTKENVRAKETIAIAEEKEDANEIWTIEGIVAGIEKVKIVYIFDEKDKLIEVRWQLPEKTNSDSSDNDYFKLKKAMTEKYGIPLGNTSGDCYIITTTALSGAAGWVSLCAMIGVGDIANYDEWNYEYQNNQHVKIDLVQFYSGANYSSRQYDIWVGYKHFTDEELNTAKQEKEEENAAVLNDI